MVDISTCFLFFFLIFDLSYGIIPAAGSPVPQPILDNLLHIIISHHGTLEFGAVRVPATPEAYMVHYIDNLDAKMNQTTMLIENDPGEGNWTSYQKSLETKLYRNRVLETEAT